jgi:hypothetical protein
MMLSELITILKAVHPARVVPLGWDCAFSYRGDYAQLGVRRAENVSIGDMLEVLEDALNQTMQGYKGGDFIMHEYVDVYLVEDHSCCGEQIGPTLLRLLIGSPSAKESKS